MAALALLMALPCRVSAQETVEAPAAEFTDLRTKALQLRFRPSFTNETGDVAQSRADGQVRAAGGSARQLPLSDGQPGVGRRGIPTASRRRPRLRCSAAGCWRPRLPAVGVGSSALAIARVLSCVLPEAPAEPATSEGEGENSG